MKKHRLTKLISLALAVTMSACILPTSVFAKTDQSTIDDLNRKLAYLGDDQVNTSEYQAALDQKISLLQQEIDDAQAKEDAKNADITAKEVEIGKINDQVLQIQTEIDQLNAEIEQKEQEKQKTIDQLKERMIADYKTGQTSSLDLLLSASDFGEFMAGMEYIQRIAKHDKELTDTLEQQVNEIQGSKQERETKLSSLQTQKSDMETKLTEAQNERDEITAIRANKQAKQDELNSDKQKSIKHSNEVQQQIQETREELEDATQAILEAQKEAEKNNNANNSNNSSGNTDTNGNTGNTGSNNSGSVSSSGYMWPIPGRAMGDGYGPRDYGSGYHWGIDIPAPYGTDIRAAKSGTVIVSMFGYSGSGFGGYGNVVVIQHDDGHLTLYAHASSRLVSVGQRVEQGQVIAKVGSTGDSTGNHLHFEVRDRNANKLNPLNFVSPS